MKEVLGVIGGMGPMASQLFYKMVTEKTVAVRDQNHIRMLIFSDSGIPDRTEAILSGEISEVRNRILMDGKLLESSGCKGIAVACNTAHYFIDMVEQELSIPIIHMIRETARETAKSCSGKKAAILATDGTIRTGLYQEALEKEGVKPYIPSPESQRLVMHQIYDCVKSGQPADMTMWRELEKELLEAGCGKALLACTELSLIREQENLSEYYIDPMEILAIRSIEFMGKNVK